jgi:plastocyanin
MLAVVTVNCGKSEEETGGGTAPTTPTETAYQPTGDEGTITGVVGFDGLAPVRKKIQMDADPVCAQKNANALSDSVVVNDGKLQNVFVYVKSGATDKYSFAASQQEVVLDQQGCMYVPHVLGIQTGQNLKIISSDATSHNVHPMPANNPEWNVTQPPGSDPIIRNFARTETMIPVKCNQHPWMKGYIGVLKHPFYAVSKEDGSFEIKGLPPGDYEIEAWHETYKAQSMKVTIAAKESKTVDFTYKADQAYGPGSLPMAPAMVLPCCGGTAGHEK